MTWNHLCNHKLTIQNHNHRFSIPLKLFNNCYGCCWTEGLGRKRGAAVLQYPRVLFIQMRMAAARVGGAGNACRGALPTAGKREGSSF